jgi:plastocyanin
VGTLRRWTVLIVICLAVAACAGGTGEDTTSTVVDDPTSTTEATTTVPTTTTSPSTTTTVPSTTTSTTLATTTTTSAPPTTSTTSTSTTSTTNPPATTTTTQPSGPAVFEVATGDNYFQPADLVISVGDAVRWRNVGAVAHTTTSGSRAAPSSLWNEVLDVGASYTRTFDTPGTFTYFCIIHIGQNGKVTVNP